MHQTPVQRFKRYLQEHDISPNDFAQLTGMPKTEVEGIIEGEVPITILRANHLAAAFDTEVEMWLHGDSENRRERFKPDRSSKEPSLIGSE